MNPGQVHRSATLVMSLAMLVIGIALVAQALASGGVLRAVLGALFFAAGCGRLYVLTRAGRGSGPDGTGA